MLFVAVHESGFGRFCSLIPGFGVKLPAIILAEPTVLSAVGACAPHDARVVGISLHAARWRLLSSADRPESKHQLREASAKEWVTQLPL